MWVNKTLQTIAIKSMMINCYEQRCFGLLVTVTRKKKQNPNQRLATRKLPFLNPKFVKYLPLLQ